MGDHFPNICIFAAILLGSIRICSTVNILMFPYGHFNHPMLPHVEYLSVVLASNHSVSILINDAYEQPKDQKEVGVKVIAFKRPDCDFKQSLNMSLDQYATASLMKLAKLEMGASTTFCTAVLEDENLLKTLKDAKFDLLVLDDIEICGRLIAGYLDIPVITLHWDLSAAKMENMEFSFDLSHFPHDFLSIGDHMTFTQRVKNVLDFIVSGFWYNSWLQKMSRLGYQHGVPMKEIYDLSLIYGSFPFEYPTQISPDMVFAGDLLIKPPKPLPKDAKSFIDSAQEGVIVLSFGNFIFDYGEASTQDFIDAFTGIPQKVIWHYQGENPPKQVPSNVKLVKDFPRSSYLANSKVKLFISGSEIDDAFEAAYFGKPIIAIPMQYESYRDAYRLAKHFKMGVKLDILTLTGKNLKNGITEVLSNEKYATAAEKIRDLVKAQPMTGKDTLMFWVDYMICNCGAKQLIPFGRHMPWYKYYLIDVALFFTISFLLLIYGIYRVFRNIKNSMNTSEDKGKKQKEKTH